MTTTTTTYRVEICRDGVWAGSGRLVSGSIRDCGAVLGPDQDASEDTYGELEDLLVEQLEETPEDWDAPVAVSRPDGRYTASLMLID